jgi:HAD superfamily phosphatase (TIGR01681 family)
MQIQLSRYVHLTPVGDDRTLVLHAVSQLRLVVDAEVAKILSWFAGGLANAPVGPGMAPNILAGCLATLMEQGVLTALAPDEEAATVSAQLSSLYDRDPGAALDAVRRAAKTGADPYWSVRTAAGAGDLALEADARTVLFFGDCDLQMEADFLRAAATARGRGVIVVTAFPDDVRIAEEREHDAAFIGALRSRRQVALWDERCGPDPTSPYLAEARQLLTALRARTKKPIFLDGLPEPTLQPLGAADRGPNGHRNRFRRLNLALEALAEEFADVHYVDVAAALGGAGARTLLDDGLVGFSHFGSPGWMLQRPRGELAAVHGLFPDVAPLRAALGGDPYGRERLLAETHLDAMQIVLGDERRKCVIVDLDGVLWPGVLAETGAPFAWSPEVSGPYSYIGLYFGLHEALKALKRRGVLLACVSKNDEDLVRRLWTYPDGYPKERLLTLEDFVSVRINWVDKAQNIRFIAEELAFATSAFAFIDDHPVERARVKGSFRLAADAA